MRWVITFNIAVDCHSAIASKLAPTLGFGVHRSAKQGRSTVGAGLLAKGPSHPTSMSTDTPLSRASPLPHLNLVAATSAFQLNPSSRQIRTTCRRSSAN
ncbi:hypothetical protein EAH78_15250 [Pseudomonas arsenicoxydans]|uniref:Uncharacterized protein n=1 Tax=Pseudomonas arsenicoxydans TaxID=702115 RepID=A0A502HWN8_9PSED|nr:hypothetical protein EAH78_15250 [Pseudomonas arsenicoxydans]